MLQDIRDNSQGVIAKVIIGLIVAIFVLFGAESIIGGLTRAPGIAEVNGEEISDFQLQQGVQELINSIGGSAEGIDQSLLEQIAINQIVEETLLRQAAQAAALGISAERIDRAIIDNPNFQVGGRFEPEFAVRTMNSQGFSIQSYKDALSRQMLLSQVVNAYSSSGFATESELQTLASLSAQTRDFRYLTIPPGTRTLGTPITGDEIAAYYESNQARFVRPESVTVDYVVLDKTSLADAIELEEGAVQAQYEIERSSFEGSAEKRASHILFETGSTLSVDQAIEAATAAIERLNLGESFESLALELSSDQVSAEEGGDIGFSDGSAFPSEIEEALEGLVVGDTAGPVETEFGIHVVKLTEDNSAVFQSFDEVAVRIERDLKSAQVEQSFAGALSDLSNLAFESSDLQRLSDELGLDILTSGDFDRSGGGLFSEPRILEAAFSDEVMLDGNNSDVIEIGEERAVVLRVNTITPEGILPLDDVEPEIAVALRSQMERDAVTVLGNELATLLEAGSDTGLFLADNELQWRSEVAVRRTQSNVNREIIESIFALPAPASGSVSRSQLSLTNGTFVMAELTSVTEGSFDALADAEKSAMRESVVGDLGSSELRAFVANLRETGDIVVPERDLDGDTF
ncbi:SurA N-terminal domain-containing protein [Gammaproteobacteria bacterium]|nr:SurA N-terminal domain-containing protein [Gammaproteobacteria bacterium]